MTATNGLQSTSTVHTVQYSMRMAALTHTGIILYDTSCVLQTSESRHFLRAYRRESPEHTVI